MIWLDIALSEDSAEVLVSIVKETSFVAPGNSFYWVRKREKEFVPLFFSRE